MSSNEVHDVDTSKSERKKSKKHKKEQSRGLDDEDKVKEKVEEKLVEDEAPAEDHDEETKDKKKKKKKRKHEDHDDREDERKDTEHQLETKKKKSEDKEKEKEKDNEKNSPADPALEVHTANNWESVDLGSEDRKLKFLKLMGATKHHDDEEQVSHKHYRTKDQDEKVKQELEKQFNEGLSSKIHHKVHCGLGFDDSQSNTSANKSSYYSNANRFKQASSTSSTSSQQTSAKDKYKMTFVKSSQ